MSGIHIRAILVSGIFLLISSSNTVWSQYFDPVLDDQTYLNRIENEVKAGVEDAQNELIRQARVIEDVTKTFVGAKLKENLFKALRTLAESELKGQQLKGQGKQTKQSNSKQDEEGEDEGDNKSAINTSGNATTAASVGLIPRVANIIRTIFGGQNRVNLTSYVEAATKYLPDSVGNQVIGVVKLLSQSPAATQRRSTTLIPTSLIYPTTEEPEISTRKPAVTAAPTTKPTVAPEEDEEDEDNSKAKQLRLPDLSGGLSLLGTILGGQTTSKSSTTAKTPQGKTTESASGFEEETTSSSASLANFANDVRNGFGDLIKVVPDLFKGAREGVSLLSALRELFGSFGGR